MKGFSSATWIIEKIEVFALAAGDPFSADELHMLRQSSEFFNDSNRAAFFKVNEKTVRLIREAIMDEKLAGADCMEVRAGLFIPLHWCSHYLDIYESNIPWLISHCAQSAMLHDPTLGETKNWDSPLITSGLSDSTLETREDNDVSPHQSSGEFENLSSAIQLFLMTMEQIFVCTKGISVVIGWDDASKESRQFLSRNELLNILNAFSEIDDDVTSAWSLLVLDPTIHDYENDYREVLRSHTKFGINNFYNKREFLSKKLIDEDFCSKPNLFYLNSILHFDWICKSIGIEAIATKQYAVEALRVAQAVNSSSVFTIELGKPKFEIFLFATMLLEIIDVIESHEAGVDTIEDLREKILSIKVTKINPSALLVIARIKDDLDDVDFLDEWRNGLFSTVRTIAANSVPRESSEYLDVAVNSDDSIFSEKETRSASVRLRDLDDLLENGLISEEEYEGKRQQIIDQI